MIEIKKEDVKKMLVWDNDGDPKAEMYVLATIGKNYICSSSLDYIDKVWIAYQNAEPLEGEKND